MKSKKQSVGSMNISVGKVFPDATDTMISELLQNEETLRSFVKASQKDGLSDKEIQSQLKYFGVKALLT